ncbi:MAG TPA: LysM peptidoglycan-binding domain-containing protein [Bacillales bacterium]|nr:LysM peptidoglycan-binding domain-containing protein [Bacillales bacterium]
MFIYVVRRGDTLFRLAQRFNVTVEQLMNANELPNPNRLVPGQALIVPSATRPYTVQPGETLAEIARRFGVTVSALAETNQIADPSAVAAGTLIAIPPRRYTVRRGDTVFAIARRFGVPVRSIMEANNLSRPEALVPGMTLVIPVVQPVIDVNGFLTVLGERGRTIIRDVGEHLTYVGPFAYRMRPDGGLETIEDLPVLEAARTENVVPMMTITNFTATEVGSQLAHTILANEGLQNTLLTNIIQIMRRKGYRGVNFDFESVLPEDRENYNLFLRRAVARLHNEGFFVSTSLAPKTRPDEPGLLYEAHDYPAHGEIVDFVVLMTYEWGYRKGPARAISPVNLMRNVLDYAVSVIPRNKLLLGISTYARDWRLPFVQGSEAETFSPQEAVRRASEVNATIQYDPVAESPFYDYWDRNGARHRVWFEDARSVMAKYQLIKDYRLRGASYWVLDFPFPQNWVVLENMFTVRKRT